MSSARRTFSTRGWSALPGGSKPTAGPPAALRRSARGSFWPRPPRCRPADRDWDSAAPRRSRCRSATGRRAEPSKSRRMVATPGRGPIGGEAPRYVSGGGGFGAHHRAVRPARKGPADRRRGSRTPFADFGAAAAVNPRGGEAFGEQRLKAREIGMPRIDPLEADRRGETVLEARSPRAEQHCSPAGTAAAITRGSSPSGRTMRAGATSPRGRGSLEEGRSRSGRVSIPVPPLPDATCRRETPARPRSFPSSLRERLSALHHVDRFVRGRGECRQEQQGPDEVDHGVFQVLTSCPP